MEKLATTNLVERVKQHELYDTILRQLEDGMRPYAIARWLQDEMLEFTEVRLENLTRAIQKIFHEIPAERRVILLTKGSQIQRTVRQQRRAISTLEELEKLYLLQMGRIEIDHATEIKINKLFSGLNNEIELARRILSDIHRIEQDHGIVGKAPERVDITTGGRPLIDEQSFKTKLGLLAKRLIEKSDVVDVEYTNVEEGRSEHVVDS